jgi:rod shape-determining protein MreD
VTLLVLAGAGFDLLMAGPHGRRILWGVSPDPAVLALVWLALRTETWTASLGAFILGFLRDGVSSGPAGGWALVMVLTVFLLKALTGAVEIGRSWGAALLCFASVVIEGVVLYPILMYIYMGLSPVGVIFQYTSVYCIQAVVTAILALALYKPLDRAAFIRRD